MGCTLYPLNESQYVKNLQQVVDDYYNKCPTEVMSRLEHQITDIMNDMYDSITNDNFDNVSRPIETSDIDNDFMREYDNMHKSMEDRQIADFYDARRHIQSAMKGDTPAKTGKNRQCIDNVTDYDREHNRIFKSVHHRLDLGPNMLPGAQQHTTVESAAALKIQDKIEGKYDENMQNINGQYRNEMYKRAENMIPQLDGTFNVSDDNDSDLHSYLDLAGTNIIAYRMRGQKQRHEVNERANTNRCSALKEYTKVMMPSLFDGTKPATSKQHYERFNLYINFQTKSGHLTDPVEEAIDLFEHTLDKTELVWFQMNR